LEDPSLKHTVELLGTNQVRDFALEVNGMLRFRGKLCVPTNDELKRMILE